MPAGCGPAYLQGDTVTHAVDGGDRDVFVMDLSGKNVRRVTDNPERDDYPSWHPDGKRLVIVSERQGEHDLYVVDVP